MPEVKHLPVKYLFEPWKAPLKVQKAARCIVGEDYPDPVADHIKQRIICVQRLKDLCFSLDILGNRIREPTTGSSLGCAPGCHAGGREFETPAGHSGSQNNSP